MPASASQAGSQQPAASRVCCLQPPKAGRQPASQLPARHHQPASQQQPAARPGRPTGPAALLYSHQCTCTCTTYSTRARIIRLGPEPLLVRSRVAPSSQLLACCLQPAARTASQRRRGRPLHVATCVPAPDHSALNRSAAQHIPHYSAQLAGHWSRACGSHCGSGRTAGARCGATTHPWDWQWQVAG